ncbi:PAS domain S-box protein [Peribacillus asahii]|uniref:PAS domain-containing sensor histidine kinase n=1 Tax=Peribacillus asahii TaxID=228899 RepID=UPI0037F5E7A6
MEKTGNVNWEFETIMKHTLDILVIVDQNQLVKYVTPSLAAILGYATEDFMGKNAFDLLHPEDRDRMIASHNRVILTKEPMVNEYRVFHKNGGMVYLESRVMLVQNHPDNLVVVSIRDITARKNMENELENRKTRYQVLQNKLKRYSQDLSSVMKVSDLNNRLIAELKSVLPNSDPKMTVYHRESKRFEGDAVLGLSSFLSKLTVGKLRYDNEQIHILIGDYKEKAYILTIKAPSISESMDAIWFETLVYYTVMVFESLNVIENLMNQLEKALQKNERPQWILRLLFNLSEKQRMELSSDLHDTVLQNQMALYRNLEAILKDHHFDNEMDDQLKGIVQGLMGTIHQIKMTCNELRPPLLKEVGLIRSLENLFDYTQLSSAFKITFTTEQAHNLELSEEETIGMYRIVQELLNNAVKHSEAAQLYFHLYRQAEKLHLHYSDDGKGFATEKLTPSFKSMGLSGMRERVQSLNGTIEFFSQPGNGLSVRVQIPLHA